jgi:hypothetical protein
VQQTAENRSTPRRFREVWAQADAEHLGPGQRTVIVAWVAFTVTFAFVRALTYWIRRGHGPKSGGLSLHGRHFHHYNIGIALLIGIGAVALRGAERHRRHPLVATAYGAANALIVDELMLLLDLADVYWAPDGRRSVDAAIGAVGLGGIYAAAIPFWHHLVRDLARSRRER